MGDFPLIELIALLVSFFAIGISIYELTSNRPKLRVLVGSAAFDKELLGIAYTDTPREFLPDELPNGAECWVSVEVTNFGRQPTNIKAITFVKSEKENLYLNPAPTERSAPLPTELGPGQFAKFFFPAAALIEGTETSLGSFVFKDRPKLWIRHSWDKKPLVVKRLQK